MSSFEVAFPGYVDACAALFRDLMPFAFCILVMGVILDFWYGPPTPDVILKTFIKAFLILVFLLRSSAIVNEGQVLIKTWVEQKIPARPENVAERYSERLREAQQLKDRDDESFIDQVLGGDWYEAIVLAVLTLISWLALAILAFVYSVQRAVLLACWSLCPLLVPCLAVRPISGIGLQHILRLLGIMLWPVGLALAATLTEGLIEVISSGTSFANAGFGEAVGKGLTGLLGITVLAVWIILSTIFAPLFIQRLITGAGGPVTALMQVGSMASTAFVSTVSSARIYFGNSGQNSSPNTGGGGAGRGDAHGVTITPEPPPASPAPPPPTGGSSSGASRSSDPAGDNAAQAIIDRFKR